MKLLPGRKTVETVMATFTKTIADLNSVAEQNENASTAMTDQVMVLESQISASDAEASKARSISAKLEELVG